MTIKESIFSVNQVRQIEKHLILDQKIPEFTLMQNAGKAAFEIIKSKIKDSTNQINIFCGAGNNGGDGFIIASLAADLGVEINCYQVGNFDKQSDIARKAKDLAIKSGVKITDFNQEIKIAKKSIIIDAILGIGIKGEVKEDASRAIELINRSKALVIAIDNPSGIDCDSGEVLGSAVKADLTVTFLGQKQGLYLKYGPKYSGKIEFSDLGADYSQYLKKINEQYKILPLNQIKNIIPPRELDSNKGDYGHALIIGGDYGMGGAPIMSALACTRSGAGRVTVLTQKDNILPLTASAPHIMSAIYNSKSDLETAIKKKTILAIGPGLGQEKWGIELFEFFMNLPLPKIIDADALNLLSKATKKYNLKNAILTPHPKEAARLLGVSVEEIQKDRKSAITKLQEKYNAIIILKGANSLIINHQKEIYLCPYGGPALAKAGTGDVLTGIITGIATQNIPLEMAAIIATHLHGLAGDYSAKKNGEIGAIPTDLINNLTKTLRNHISWRENMN